MEERPGTGQGLRTKGPGDLSRLGQPRLARPFTNSNARSSDPACLRARTTRATERVRELQAAGVRVEREKSQPLPPRGQGGVRFVTGYPHARATKATTSEPDADLAGGAGVPRESRSGSRRPTTQRPTARER